MKYFYAPIFGTLSLAAALSLTSCGKLSGNRLASEAPETSAQRQRAQEKWDALAAELKIHNNRVELSPEEITAIDQAHATTTARVAAKTELIRNKYAKLLSQPSAYLSDPTLASAYQERLFAIADQFAAKAYATRCAAVVSWKPAARLATYPGVAVFEMTYKLQSESGEPETDTRTGLVSIPTAAGEYPLLAFAHADDQGLSYTGLKRELGSIQSEAIVVAPSFPGEPVCAGKLGQADPKTGARNLSCAMPEELISPPVGTSIPWDNDVDELLGMHDCVSKVAMGHYRSPELVDDEGLITHHLVGGRTNEETGQQAAGELALALKDKVLRLKRMGMQSIPLSLIVGASRGGLVASLALAKAGAHWNQLFKAIAASKVNEKLPGFTQTLMGYYFMLSGVLTEVIQAPKEERKTSPKNAATLDDAFAFIAEALGPSYGLVPPPAFNGIATLASPASVLIGRMRLQLEQMVKGNTDVTSGMFLPGIRELTHIFDDYREKDGVLGVREAASCVLQRDMTFLAPLMLASLKSWDRPAAVTRGAKDAVLSQLFDRGSFLMVHHGGDRVVPFEQMQMAANLLLGHANDADVRAKSFSPSGVELQAVSLVAAEESKERVDYHLDQAYYKKSKVELAVSLIDARVLKMVYGKSEYFGVAKTPSGELPSDFKLINERYLKARTIELQKAADSLAAASTGFVHSDFGFTPAELSGFFAEEAGPAASDERAAILGVLRYHALTAQASELSWNASSMALEGSNGPAEILATWRKRLFP